MHGFKVSPLLNLVSHPNFGRVAKMSSLQGRLIMVVLLAGAHLWHGPSAPSASLWFSRNINCPSQIPAYHALTSLLSKHLSPFKTKSNSNLPCETGLMLFRRQNLPVLPSLPGESDLCTWNTSLYQFVYSAAFPNYNDFNHSPQEEKQISNKTALLHTVSLDVRQLQECLIYSAAHWHHWRSRP